MVVFLFNLSAIAIFFLVLVVFFQMIDITAQELHWFFPRSIDGYKIFEDWYEILFFILLVWLLRRSLRVVRGRPFYREDCAGRRVYFKFSWIQNFSLGYLLVGALFVSLSPYSSKGTGPGEAIKGMATYQYQGQTFEFSQLSIKPSPEEGYRYRVTFEPLAIKENPEADQIELFFDLMNLQQNRFVMMHCDLLTEDGITGGFGKSISLQDTEIKEADKEFEIHFNVPFDNGISTQNNLVVAVNLPKSVLKRM